MQILRTDPDRFGIRARLLTLLLPAILGLLALDSWNDYRALRNLVKNTYDQTLLQTATVLHSSLAPGPDGALRLTTPALASQMIAGTAGVPHQYVHVGLTPRSPVPGSAASEPKEVVLLGEASLPAPTPSPPHEVGAPTWYDSFYRGEWVRVVALRGVVVDGRGQAFDLLIQAAEATGTHDQTLEAYRQQALIRDARMVLVVILLAWLGVTWSLQPLERLRKSVLQSKGHVLQTLDTSDVPHEVAPLVDAINQHVTSYRVLLDQQAQFLADASHQLRTPLAIMLTQTGVALREKDPEQVHHTLRAIVTQISRSRRLCEQLLALAHASDTAPTEEAPQVVDLRAIAREVVLQHLALAHEKNQDLGWVDIQDQAPQAPKPLPAPTSLPVLAHGAELHEALSNLVHNAIIYTPAGGSITVLASVDGGFAQVEVRDDGPGIAEPRRAAVFERFHHTGTPSDGSAHHGARGAGLGLAIARAYARRNQGDIVLADAASAEDSNAALPGRTGLRAILRLPLAF